MPSSSPPRPPAAATPQDLARRWLLRSLAVMLLGVAAAAYPKLSFPAVFFCLVALVATPKLTGPARLRVRAAIALALVGSTVGLLRFVLVEAIPGVLAGGRTAIERQAVSFLRTLVTAQDHARGAGLLDPDADGVGSALGLLELSGLGALPDGERLDNPPLALRRDELRETARGEAVRHAGYLVMVCLPQVGGGYAAAPATRDPELAERSYALYAWPEGLGSGSPTTVYFADAYERILALDSDAAPRYVGTTRPPPCDAAPSGPGWTAWKDKQPRAQLPGGPKEAPVPARTGPP